MAKEPRNKKKGVLNAFQFMCKWRIEEMNKKDESNYEWKDESKDESADEWRHGPKNESKDKLKDD